MSEDKFKNMFFLGLKRKPVQIFTLEDIQAMEQKTNDEYENSDAEMFIEDGNFNKFAIRIKHIYRFTSFRYSSFINII